MFYGFIIIYYFWQIWMIDLLAHHAILPWRGHEHLQQSVHCEKEKR